MKFLRKANREFKGSFWTWFVLLTVAFAIPITMSVAGLFLFFFGE